MNVELRTNWLSQETDGQLSGHEYIIYVKTTNKPLEAGWELYYDNDNIQG